MMDQGVRSPAPPLAGPSSLLREGTAMPSCPPGCCHASEDRRADDSIPLPCSVPYSHRIRLGDHTISTLPARGSLSGGSNPSALSYRGSCFRHACRSTRRSNEQEEASPNRYDANHSSDRSNRLHKEPAERLRTPRSNGCSRRNRGGDISHLTG